MKVVLDTNVFVSGIHWSGASEKVLRAWFSKTFILVSSAEIIDEFVNTMASFKKPIPIEDILWWEGLILERAKIVVPKKKFKVVKDDPDDDKFVEAAVEGEADYIISQDKHLLKLEEFEGIKIVKPEKLLKFL